MKYLNYKLFSDGFINRFITVGVFSKDSPYEKAVLQGKVNEWLLKGPAIHDNPCRRKIIEKRKGKLPPYIAFDGMYPGNEVEIFSQTKKLNVYFPFGNTGVDDSQFFTNPAYLRSYGFTYLHVLEEEIATMQISTCGALTIWVNDELVTDFVPFHRNVEHHDVIKMKLKKGTNKIVVCLEDIAERDTDFCYKIRYMGKQDIEILLPVEEETDTELVYKAEEALSKMYFEKEAYLSEDVYLNLESFSEEPVAMILTPDRYADAQNHIIQPGQTQLHLFHANDIPSSFYFFNLEMTISGLTMRKVIGTYSFNTRFKDCDGDTYEERKKRIHDIIIAEPENNEYRMIVMLNDGETPKNMDAVIEGWLKWIEPKKDCSDFRMIQLIYVYIRFAEKMNNIMRERVKRAMLEYRYWIDEPGNDVMWFFSENHSLMFHVSQYFAGLALPNEVFEVSGLTGTEATNKAERLLEEWFEGFFVESTTEWNSSTYLPIDVMGLAYLYDLTEKGTNLHEKSKKALDMLAYCLAINEHKGNIMTSFGRTYERELKGSYSTGMPSLLYLWYNSGHMNDNFRALAPLIIGDYEPPKDYVQYVALKGTEELIHQNTQGIDQYVNLYLYKNAKALLSTAIGFRPYGPGYQENVVQATLDGTAQVFINHPGEVQIYGHGRPGFWAGNGCLPMAAQYRNLSILEYHINGESVRGDSCLEYTHAYVPLSEFDSYKVSKSAIALEKDGGFIGIRSLNALVMQTVGPCRRREFISAGKDNLWVVKVGKAGEYQNVDELLIEMESMQLILELNRNTIVVNGDMIYQISNQKLLVNGEIVHQYPMDVAGKIEFVK